LAKEDLDVEEEFNDEEAEELTCRANEWEGQEFSIKANRTQR
jgi:hypothetical protein